MEEAAKNKVSLSDLREPYILKPLAITLALMVFQQLAGVNAVIYNINLIFQVSCVVVFLVIVDVVIIRIAVSSSLDRIIVSGFFIVIFIIMIFIVTISITSLLPLSSPLSLLSSPLPSSSLFSSYQFLIYNDD